LKDDSEPSPANGSPEQLVPVAVGFVPAQFEVGEEALHCFLERNVVNGQFISFEIILEVSRGEAMPIDQCLRTPIPL
jgi:hypothetical protein